MTDIATLQQDLETLKAARRSGTLEVQHKLARRRFRSDEELAREIFAIETEIAKLSGAPCVRNVVLRSPPDRGW
jgi:hypothetical protein